LREGEGAFGQARPTARGGIGMRVAVYGLGYVGCVSAACLAREGHEVTGVDLSPLKVDLINEGRSPIVEPGLAEVLGAVAGGGAGPGRLHATADASAAAAASEISLICVGTPGDAGGSLDLSHVARCAREIGRGLDADPWRVVVVRSTVLPGSVEGVVVPALEEASGLVAGRDFGVAMNPEFLRESTSLEDFYDPPVTVIGALDERSAGRVSALYEFLRAPVVVTELRSAEMIKYANNAFHALKVSFANEIGAVCKALGVDGHGVMDVLCMDRKLNLSPYYLRPGFAFGGSCLPKDLRALARRARTLDVEVPVLQSILPSNRLHLERAVADIQRSGCRRIAILGLSFKAGTDDLRESPMVVLAETLIGKGFELRIHDRSVSVARLVGANREYIEREIPHLASLMTGTLDEALDHAELIVVGNRGAEFADLLGRDLGGRRVYDLVRLDGAPGASPDDYEGICW